MNSLAKTSDYWSNIHYESIVYYLSLVITLIHFKLGYINSDKLVKTLYTTPGMTTRKFLITITILYKVYTLIEILT